LISAFFISDHVCKWCPDASYTRTFTVECFDAQTTCCSTWLSHGC